MKFVFDYEETLTRRVVIHADCLSDALHEIERRIEDEEIILGAEDFVGGQISMPMEENFFPQLNYCGEGMENIKDLDLVVDSW